MLNGCATVEVAKEVTKATNSIKTTIKKITLGEEKLEEKVSSEEKLEEKVSIEKKEISIEKIKEEKAVIKQNKIATIHFIGKTIDELRKQLGEPKLLREDGKSITARFDTQSCRIFIFFNTSIKQPGAKYYELRNTKGKLIEKQKDIEKCFGEIKLV